MLLKEFFGPAIELGKKANDKEVDKQFDDDVFFFILDHDRLHKDYFFPIAKKLSKLDSCSDKMINELFMPMVIKGCKEYYHKNKLEGRMGKCFPLSFREGLCKKLYDHYHNDVKKKLYRVG